MTTTPAHQQEDPNTCPHCGDHFVVATLVRLHIAKHHSEG